ncbi:hypothetical protein [Streptomyces mutomycini]|uniref:Uncharacterized protein n=1 Tax=Streptomyces mutomycini TaxID=284036 RepID=A0ABW0AWC8_9ACTN|nr:hypothetical protein [Streptomyces mutomycini]
MNDVRELLERAAEGAGRPAVSTGAVYARAARIRLRRRAAGAVAVLAVVAAGGAALPGLTGPAATEQTSVAAVPVSDSGRQGKAESLTALLPRGVGDVTRVSLLTLTKNATPEQAEKTYAGPLDGEYLIRKDGGTGYLLLRYMKGSAVAERSGGTGLDDVCAARSGEPAFTDCAREELPDGSILTTWSDSMAYAGQDGTPEWGPERVGRLELGDGSLLVVRASSGYLGDRSQGPLLTGPPLDQEQLRTLIQRPELLPHG